MSHSYVKPQGEKPRAGAQGLSRLDDGGVMHVDLGQREEHPTKLREIANGLS